MTTVSICHPHNLNRDIPSQHPFGVRVRLRQGDPFARLVGADWEKTHWFATERERDEALADMSRPPFLREGDAPALVFEKVDTGDTAPAT